MTPNQIERLTRLVADKGWSAFDLIAHPELTTIEAITQMLRGLPSNEIDLSLDLLDDYIIIKDYSSAARSLMVGLRDLEEDNPILVTPLIDYQSERTKSGHSLHYEMSNFTGLFGARKVLFRDDPKSTFSQEYVGIHVSVDDYIGTGSQFFGMIESIIKDGKTDTISHIATICIQESAKIALEAAGYQIIALNVLGKGLDRLAHRRGLPKAKVLSEYEILERKTTRAAKYRLGRDESEALVTMKATPNNTLPIFWIEGRAKWPAPFPRPRR